MDRGLQISVVIQDWLIISDLVTYLIIYSWDPNLGPVYMEVGDPRWVR